MPFVRTQLAVIVAVIFGLFSSGLQARECGDFDVVITSSKPSGLSLNESIDVVRKTLDTCVLNLNAFLAAIETLEEETDHEATGIRQQAGTLEPTILSKKLRRDLETWEGESRDRMYAGGRTRGVRDVAAEALSNFLDDAEREKKETLYRKCVNDGESPVKCAKKIL